MLTKELIEFANSINKVPKYLGEKATQCTQRIDLERSQEQMPLDFIYVSTILEAEILFDVIGEIQEDKNSWTLGLA